LFPPLADRAFAFPVNKVCDIRTAAQIKQIVVDVEKSCLTFIIFFQKLLTKAVRSRYTVDLNSRGINELSFRLQLACQKKVRVLGVLLGETV